MFKEEEKTYACPDCVDQGGLYIRYYIEGKKGEFRIDTNKDKIPNYLHEFVDKINEKLEFVN